MNRLCGTRTLRVLAVVAVCAAVIASPSSVSFATANGEELSPERMIIHALNRLGFGPRPGDLEKVKEMGVDVWIEHQLHPASIPDPIVDERLAGYTSLEMGLKDLIEAYGPVAPQGIRRRATIFEKRRFVDSRADDASGPGPNAFMPTSQAARRALMEDRPADYEIIYARLLRAVYSERQLQELMTDFWMNHFNINFGDHPFAAHFEQSVIRPQTMGKFEDLVLAVAKHPGMLNYLDNWRSSAPSEVIEARLAALEETLDHNEYLVLLEREAFLKSVSGLNENFARELMELHTIGVDGGYAQQDVIEVAKVLTGWTIDASGITNGRDDDGVFVFDELMHVDGDKVVLGQTFVAGGVEEGEQVIRMLARHPSAARFISTKLARRFVADDPPEAVVAAAARTFEQTGGDIREVLRTIFASPEFRSTDYYQVKIKKPLELVASALRATNAKVTSGVGLIIGGNQNPPLIRRMGENIYNHETPDGNPDVAAAWVNTNALLTRLLFANQLANNEVQGVDVDLEAAEELLTRLGMPVPTPEQLSRFHAAIVAARAQAEQERQEMGEQPGMMAGGGPAAVEEDEEFDPRALAIATMLGSPNFQKR